MKIKLTSFLTWPTDIGMMIISVKVTGRNHVILGWETAIYYAVSLQPSVDFPAHIQIQKLGKSLSIWKLLWNDGDINTQNVFTDYIVFAMSSPEYLTMLKWYYILINMCKWYCVPVKLSIILITSIKNSDQYYDQKEWNSIADTCKNETC